MLLGKLVADMATELKSHSPLVASARFVRLVSAYSATKLAKCLLNSRSAQLHQNLTGKSDSFFALSHKHYLCKSLNSTQRVDAARSTYHFIDNELTSEAFAAVTGEGLKLWKVEANDHKFDLRLMLGNDNMYEGGLSCVFYVDDKRVGVMSFAVIDAKLLTGREGRQILICRNQTTSDRWYQKPLQDTFKQIALPYMMLAGLAGVAKGLSLNELLAVTEDEHPHGDDATAKLMSGSYSQFWSKYHAEQLRKGIVRIGVPLETTPLDQVSSNHRRRAKARREVMESVTLDTAAALDRALKPVMQAQQQVLMAEAKPRTVAAMAASIL